MGKTDYKGIDYSLGQSNVDSKTGIHYGVISIHEVGQSWFDDSQAYYGKPVCPSCNYQFKKSKYPSKCPNCQFRPYDPETEFLSEEPISFYYDSDGYYAEQSNDDPDIFVIKSPYYTWCQYCSPCAPGAGYLINYTEPEIGIKAYCFNHDWFESIKTDKWIECKHCKGTGLRNKSDIHEFNELKFIKNGGKIFGDKKVYCWVCYNNIEFGMMGHVHETIQKAPYPVYSVKTNELIEPIKGD